MSSTFTMYSTPWCGYCHRLKSQLDREGIPFEIVAKLSPTPNPQPSRIPGTPSEAREISLRFHPSE